MGRKNRQEQIRHALRKGVTFARTLEGALWRLHVGRATQHDLRILFQYREELEAVLQEEEFVDKVEAIQPPHWALDGLPCTRCGDEARLIEVGKLDGQFIALYWRCPHDDWFAIRADYLPALVELEGAH